MASSCPVGHWPASDTIQPSQLIQLKNPTVFHGKIESWDFARSWIPELICDILSEKTITFKVCPLRGTRTYRKQFEENQVLFETHCQFVEATFAEFREWLEEKARTHEGGVNSGGGRSSVSTDAATRDGPLATKQDQNRDQSRDVPVSKKARLLSGNPLLRYPPSQYWVYADYKYMSELCSEVPELLCAIDWSAFGFDGRDGTQSTLWVGSRGANTPCHYDTYGCNLVAQLSGKKKWVLFPPEDTAKLYPSRLPFEESSVFSSVNVQSADLSRHPDFATATAHEVLLTPGDVLYVPPRWWHYVECVEDAVSVNTWLELPSDDKERVKEALVRTLVSTVFECGDENVRSKWLNPNEVLFPLEQNLQLLTMAVQAAQGGEELTCPITEEDLIAAATDSDVVEMMVSRLLGRLDAKMTRSKKGGASP